MSAPSSGSSGSTGGSPVPGYYPDPSIPGYIRYWNGSAWVPGTSRPAPLPGEEIGPPPVTGFPGPSLAAPAGPAGPAGPGAPAGPRMPAMDESGPMFLDEDPHAPFAVAGPAAETAAASSAAGPAAPPSRTGSPAGAHPGPSAAGAAHPVAAPVPPQPGSVPVKRGPGGGVPPQAARGGAASPGEAATGSSASSASPASVPPAGRGAASGSPWAVKSGPGLPSQAPSAGSVRPAADASPGGAVPWAQQVHELARPGAGSGRGDSARGGGGGVVPWRPPISDPFLLAAQDQSRPAGLGRRLAARLVDSLVVAGATAVAAVPLGTAAYHHIQDKVDAARLTGERVTVWLIDGTTGVQLGIVLAVALVAGLLCEVLPTAKWGRTLGKKLFGLQVLDIESQLAPGFGAALRRWLTHTVLDAVGIGFLGLAWCVFDRPWRQCWHDKAARTFVAKG